MRVLRRICAKLLDYFWFWSFLLLIIDAFDGSLWLYAAMTVFLPLLFIPIEATLLFLFRTTLGKILFGFRFKRSLTFKESLYMTTKKALLLTPLFIPPLNLFFIFYYIKKYRKSENKWDYICITPLERNFPKKWGYSGLCLLGIITSLIAFTPEFSYRQLNKVVSLEQPNFIKNKSFKFFSDNWVKVTPDELIFSIFFPKTPKYSEKKHSVPRSSTVLVYKEYMHTGDLNYSLSFIELPSSWTRWGASLVLKGSLNFLCSHGKIHHKKKCKHLSFPAMEYQMERDKHLFLGKLVLVGNTIYKIEVELKDSATNSDDIQKFINSFHPRPSRS